MVYSQLQCSKQKFNNKTIIFINEHCFLWLVLGPESRHSVLLPAMFAAWKAQAEKCFLLVKGMGLFKGYFFLKKNDKGYPFLKKQMSSLYRCALHYIYSPNKGHFRCWQAQLYILPFPLKSTTNPCWLVVNLPLQKILITWGYYSQ